jgi:hypothetical protein
MKKAVLLLLLAMTLSDVLIAQSKVEQTYKVLVIPFSRFEFHTEIKLSEINKANGLEGDQFYPQLIAHLTEAFEIASSEEVAYTFVTEDDLRIICKELRYGLIGNEAHYSCIIEKANEEAIRQLLDNYECDYLLTLNWYRIMETNASLIINKKKKIGVYSYHYIDYDFFNRDLTLKTRESKLKMEVSATADNFKYLGLRLQDLKPYYKKMVDKITLNIISNN